MAVRAAIATGNFLTAGTWGLIDATSYSNSESTTTALTTSYQASSGTTTGVETLDGVGLKLSVRTGTTGSMSVHLAIAGVEVPGTLVTINTADLPVAATADLNGGWIFFQFSAPVTLVGATSYTIEAKTSSASQVSLFSTATTNWSRYFRTTTTGAPAAGDDLIITGIHTTTGAPAAVTVTMDALASSITDYGAASTSLVTPSLSIGNSGKLAFGITATTNYYLRQSGNVIVYSGGELDMGKSGSEMPRDSSGILNFDSGANVDFGLTVRNLGTYRSYGLSRTSAKNIVSCKLNTDEAIASTSLGVDTDTGWLDNDVIAVASTTRTAGDCEAGAMNGNAAASTLTVDGFAGAGGGLAVAHSGTSPTQAEVILLTRNVQVFGASATLQGYIDIKATATIDVQWTEYKWLGSATANKRGIDVAITTGSCSITNSSIHDCTVASSIGFNASAASGNGFTFSNNVTFNIANNHFAVTNTTNTTWTVDSNVFIRNTDVANVVLLNDVGGIFTNNTIVGAAGATALNVAESGASIGTFSGNTQHSSGSIGVSFQNIINSTISTLTIWRNTGIGLQLASVTGCTFSTLTLFGNTTSNIQYSVAGGGNVFINVTSNGDTTFSTTNGIAGNNTTQTLQFMVYNSNFSTASGIKTAHTQDINIAAGYNYQVILNNTILAAATEISGQTGLSNGSFISSQKHDQTAGLHKTWKKYGIIAIDTGTVHTGSQSMSLTPNNASNKLESSAPFGFQIAVANGATLTPAVFINKSAAYNGNQPRLILKRNDSIGVTADAVIATYASGTGSWNQISGATAAATDDGVMEFVIDCDGTAGVVYVDSFTVT